MKILVSTILTISIITMHLGYTSEDRTTEIDFEQVDVTAEMARPGLSLLNERAVRYNQSCQDYYNYGELEKWKFCVVMHLDGNKGLKDIIENYYAFDEYANGSDSLNRSGGRYYNTSRLGCQLTLGKTKRDGPQELSMWDRKKKDQIDEIDLDNFDVGSVTMKKVLYPGPPQLTLKGVLKVLQNPKGIMLPMLVIEGFQNGRRLEIYLMRHSVDINIALSSLTAVMAGQSPETDFLYIKIKEIRKGEVNTGDAQIDDKYTKFYQENKKLKPTRCEMVIKMGAYSPDLFRTDVIINRRIEEKSFDPNIEETLKEIEETVSGSTTTK